MGRWQVEIAVILIVSLLVSGCYTTRRIPAGDKLPKKTTEVAGVVLKSGETITFRNNDGLFEPATGHIMGFATDGNYRVFGTDEISHLILRKKEPISWTVAGVLVVAALVAAVIYVIFSSWHDEPWIVVN